MGFFRNVKKEEAISLVSDTIVVGLIAPAILGAKQLGVTFEQMRINEPSKGNHETYGSGWNFGISLKCDQAFLKKETLETELTFALTKFQTKHESKPILERMTQPEIAVAGNEGLIVKFFLAEGSF